MTRQMSRHPATVDEIPWGESPTERLQTATPRKCSHPRRWRGIVTSPTYGDDVGKPYCARCMHVFDPAVTRRNRNNRKRGNAIELRVCRDLGVTPRGRFGDPVDGGSDVDPYLVQVKTGGYYKPAQHVILDAMAGQRRDRAAILVTVETPGSDSGRPGRRLVTMDYDDWKRIAEALGWMPAPANPDSPGRLSASGKKPPPSADG